MRFNTKVSKGVINLICIGLLLTAELTPQTFAQVTASEVKTDRVALYQALLDLTNPWTVMCIAAHPDDEDGTSLIVMRHKYGAHTVSLFSTFGEGGQNAIGPELYEELGAIRARETMAAAEIQGSEPHFLGLKDFGYSKSADEAFRFWGHDEALRRMVLQIRKLRPDVIITNHSATNNDHGHHQATARLELEAFDAAADPKQFPEQLKADVTVWQVQRLFVRAGRSSQTQSDNAPVVSLDPNERDPIRNTIFAEEALRALQQHATQGPWPKTLSDMARFRNSPDGKLPLIRYLLVRAAKEAPSLPKNPRNFLDGLKLPDNFVTELDLPTIQGKPLVEFVDERSEVLERLLEHIHKGFHFTSGIWPNYERLSSMRRKIERATAIAAGVSLQVEMPGKGVTPNSKLEMDVKIANAGPRIVSVFGPCRSDIPWLTKQNDSKRDSGPASIFQTLADIPGGSSLHRSTSVLIPANTPINVPLANHLYESSGLGIQVRTSCEIGLGPGGSDHVSLEETRNVDVSSALEITNLSPSPIVRTQAAAKGILIASVDCVFRDADFKLRLTNHRSSQFSGDLVIGTSTGRKASTRKIAIGAQQSIDVTATVSGCLPWVDSKKGEAKAPAVSFTLMGSGATNPVARLDVPVVWADARVASNVSVGYVRGFDYSLPNALAALGVSAKELTVDEVQTSDLKKYATIIADNRVYESQPELINANQRLLDYVKDGGTLIVFYHKANEWNPDERRKRPQLAPDKLILGDERITDENAPVSFLEPQHPLLNSPNKLGPEDFTGWIQERGLYYPKEWDSQYHALLQSNDPGEAPLKGGLLVADYGSGHYIYSSMVWYRQLRAGVPGAYRMLANMISYGHPTK